MGLTRANTAAVDHSPARTPLRHRHSMRSLPEIAEVERHARRIAGDNRTHSVRERRSP